VDKITVRQLLHEHWTAWEQSLGTGVRKTQEEFADYVGVGKVTFNHVINERRPASKKLIVHFAKFFDDQRFYDAADMTRDDPKLKYIQRNWGKAPPEIRKKVADMFAPYTSDPMPDGAEEENE
jgi:hypothetical protein